MYIFYFLTLCFELIYFSECGVLESIEVEVEELWTREKCIEDLGCFYAGYPFYNLDERPISLLPDDREIINVHFLLYTLHGQQHIFSNMDSSIDNLDDSGFNPNIRTKFIIPGFMSTSAPPWTMMFAEYLLQSEECNVFLIDWSGGDGPLLEQAVANTRVVGAEIALFITKIKKKTGLPLDSIHIIGHSLGSHIAGYAGKRLNKVGRITALDPGGPYFTNVEPIVRLDRNDALFIDAIHTNAAPNPLEGFGDTESIGHIDFWPNGGHLQPGCPDEGSAIWTFLKHPTSDHDVFNDISCNHHRAIDLFIASMHQPCCKLIGNVCDNWEAYTDGSCLLRNNGHPRRFLLGINADKYAKYISNNQSINVYLNTSNEAPFCLR